MEPRWSSFDSGLPERFSVRLSVGNAGVVTPEAKPTVPTVHVRNVLLPLDGSELALQAMPTARVLAQRLGADLHTVTVADRDDDV